jgi:hypothetical protein
LVTEVRDLKITFRIENEEQYEKIKQILQKYASQKDWAGTIEQEDDKITIILTTGNKWMLSKDRLIYEGSRHGFHSFTPFGGRGRIDEKQNCIEIYEEESIKSMRLELEKYETTNPHLRWWERVEPLLEEPDKAVVLDQYGIPLRVVPYKNVYV